MTTDAHDNYNVVLAVAGLPTCFYSHTPPPLAIDVASVAGAVLTMDGALRVWPGDTVRIYETDLSTATEHTVLAVDGLDITVDPATGTGSWRVVPPGLPADIVAGIPIRPVHALSRCTPIEWQTPDIGGFVEYRPIDITLSSAGPDATHDDDPGRIFGRYDGGGWTALLAETLAADDETSVTVASSPGSFPRLIYGGQEAIAVSATSANGGNQDLTIIARGCADTPPQTHEVQANQPPTYFTAAPTEWAQRGVSIWVAPIDAMGRQVGHLVERYVGEIDGAVKVDVDAVRFTVKPLTGVLHRAPASKEAEVIELATGVHRYERGVASSLQVLQETRTTSGGVQTRVRKAVTADLHDPADADFITLAWPQEVLTILNTKLEAGRSDEADPADYDADADGGHVKVSIRTDSVMLSASSDAVVDYARVHFASDPVNFGRGRQPALPPPTDGELISAVAQLRYGVDLSAAGVGRDPVGGGADARWQHSPEEFSPAVQPGAVRDVTYALSAWPMEAYHDTREAGILTTSGLSSIPAGGAEMLCRFIDHNGDAREVPFRVLTSSDLGDGTFWLTIDPTTRLPSFGQSGTDDKVQIMRAVYAEQLPFSRFVLETLGSGTGTGALGTSDVHVDGAGVLGSRLNADSFEGIRLPGAFGSISGGALRDPTKQLRHILRLAGVSIGMDTGPDGRARLSAFRLEGARPDLLRATLNVSGTFAPSGGGGVPMEVLPQTLNTLSLKVAGLDGEEREVTVVNNRGINSANRQVFHLGGKQPDGEGVDIDLSEVQIEGVGNIAAAIYPLASRLFLLAGEARRRWTLGVDTAAFDVASLRPYDVIGLTSNLIRNESGAFGVADLPVRVVSVTTPLLDGLAQVVVEDAAATAVGWNASARITAVAGSDVTVSTTEYVDAVSPATGAAQSAVDQFAAGQKVMVYAAGNFASAVERTISSIAANVLTLNAAPPAMSAPGWGAIIPAVYANASAPHRELAYLGNAAGIVSGSVEAGLIT